MARQAGGKEELLQQAEEEWRRLLDVAQGLSEERQLLAGVAGHWSVKDLLGHVATWDDELVKVVERFQNSGEKTSYGGREGVDRFNESEAENKRILSFSQVWDELRRSHQHLLDFLYELPPESFTPGSYTGDRITIESTGHYREHREEMENWRTANR